MYYNTLGFVSRRLVMLGFRKRSHYVLLADKLVKFELLLALAGTETEPIQDPILATAGDILIFICTNKAAASTTQWHVRRHATMRG
jgi:hypothetical protein